MDIATEITRLQNAKADIKTAIESKGVTVGDGRIDTYADKIAEISGGGGSDEYRTALWNGIQQKGGRKDYQHAFRGWSSAHDYWKPIYDINMTNCSFAFYSFTSNVGLPELCERAGISIDFSRCSTYNQTFSYCNCPDVGVIDMRGTNATGSCFQYSYVKKVHIILKADGSQTHTSGAFTGATYLTDLTLEGAIGKTISFRDCPLNKASIENVFDVLLSSATGQTVTFKKTAVNTAFGINVDDESTFPEGSEYYELRNSKSNWTVSYA